jgi:hypothetical protein
MGARVFERCCVVFLQERRVRLESLQQRWGGVRFPSEDVGLLENGGL